MSRKERLSSADYSKTIKRLVEKFEGPEGEEWLREIELDLRNGLKSAVSEPTEENEVLSFQKLAVSIKCSEFSARDFFVDVEQGIQPDNIRMKINMVLQNHIQKSPIESDILDEDLGVYLVQQTSSTEVIRSKMGEDKDISVVLYSIAEFLKLQPNGQEGFLLNNHLSNVFFYIPYPGKIWTIEVHYDSTHQWWDIIAEPVNPVKNYAKGNQVVIPRKV